MGKAFGRDFIFNWSRIKYKYVQNFKRTTSVQGNYEKEIDRCAGRRMSDKESLAYCRRADLFKERMEEWLTDEFIESIKFFCDFSKE